MLIFVGLKTYAFYILLLFCMICFQQFMLFVSYYNLFISFLLIFYIFPYLFYYCMIFLSITLLIKFLVEFINRYLGWFDIWFYYYIFLVHFIKLYPSLKIMSVYKNLSLPIICLFYCDFIIFFFLNMLNFVCFVLSYY